MERHVYDPLQNIPPDPLTPLERRKLRKIIKDQEHYEWFFGWFLRISGYGAAVIGALYAVRDYIAKLIRAVM